MIGIEGSKVARRYIDLCTLGRKEVELLTYVSAQGAEDLFEESASWTHEGTFWERSLSKERRWNPQRRLVISQSLINHHKAAKQDKQRTREKNQTRERKSYALSNWKPKIHLTNVSGTHCYPAFGRLGKASRSPQRAQNHCVSFSICREIIL